MSGERQKGRSAAAFISILGASFLALGSSAVPSPLYIVYQNDGGLTSGDTTLIYAMYALGVVIPLIFLPHLPNVVGHKVLLCLGAAGVFISSIFFLWPSSVPLLILGRFIQGISTGLVTISASAALNEIVGLQRAEFAAYCNSAALTMGTAIGGIGAGAISEAFGKSVRAPFYCLMAVALIVFIALVTTLASHTKTAEREPFFQKPQISVPPRVRPFFVVGALGLFLAWSIGGLFLSLGGTIIRESFDTDNLVLGGLCLVCVQGLGGILQILISSRPAMFSSRNLYLTGVVALSVSMIIAATALGINNTVLFFVGACLAGVGFGCSVMSSAAIVQINSEPKETAQIMSAYFLVGYLAISIPSLIAGESVSRIGAFDTILGFTVVLVLLSLFGVFSATRAFSRKK